MGTEASTNGEPRRRHPSWGPGPTVCEQLSPQLQGGGSSTEASWHLPQLFMEPQLSPEGGEGGWNWGRECIMVQGGSSRRRRQDLGPIILRQGMQNGS